MSGFGQLPGLMSSGADTATVTSKVQELSFPAASRAVMVTGVVPQGNVEPLGGELSTTTSPGHSMTGGCVSGASSTVTFMKQIAVLPLGRLAPPWIGVVQIGKRAPDADGSNPG